MILFLDFDGTLHKTWEFFQDDRGRTQARRYEGPWFTEAPTLAALLAPYGNRVEVVISSWWAYTRSLDDVRALLPAELAARVVDSIWLRELNTSVWSEYRSKQATRHACIRLWLDRRRPGYSGPWLALDDDDQSWPDNDRSHLVHAVGTLAHPSVQRELSSRLVELMSGIVPEHYMLDAIAVIDLMRELSQTDTAHAVRWYQSQTLPELDGRTAELMVASGQRESVLRYLHNLSAGATG